VDNGGNQPLSVTVRLANTNGGFFGVGSSGFWSNNLVYTYTNSPANVTAAVRQLIFNPTPNYLPVGAKDTNQFTLAVTDNYVTRTNNAIRVIATSINDAPVIDGADTAHQPVQTGTSIQPFSFVTLRD